MDQYRFIGKLRGGDQFAQHESAARSRALRKQSGRRRREPGRRSSRPAMRRNSVVVDYWTRYLMLRRLAGASHASVKTRDELRSAQP